jgi:hypothetical protein
MFFVGSVLVGKKGVAYLKRRFFEGGAPTGERPTVKL